MSPKKRFKKNVTLTYLGDIIKLHMDFDILLTEKIGFLVAIAALLLTLSISGIVAEGFSSYPTLIKFALIVASVGAAFSIIMSISAEKPEKIKKVKTFHPLSLIEFNEESSRKFNNDLHSILKNDEKIIKNYSDQTLHMKEQIYKKSRKVALATYTLIGSVLLAALLACLQMYIKIFAGV